MIYSTNLEDSLSSTMSSSTLYDGVGSLKIIEKIKFQLFQLSRPLNVQICLIYGLLCFNWYLIGTQWLPDPHLLPEIECNIADLINVSWSFYEKRNITTPKKSKYEPGCKYYDYKYSLFTDLTYEQAKNVTLKIPKPKILNCKDYVIIHEVPNEISYIKEFDSICQLKRLHFVNFFVIIGMIAGGFPSGLFADVYGRRPVHIFSAIVLCVTGFLVPFSTNFELYSFGKCIQGGCLFSICITLNLIYSETCRRKYRVSTAMIAFMWFVIGSNMPNGFIYVIEVWRLRDLALAFCFLICLFGAIMFTPESPRHLMVKRQFNSAWDCLEELGCTEVRPNLQNIKMRKHRFHYQIRILKLRYFQQRLLRVLIVTETAGYFYYMFRNMTMNELKFNDILKFKILAIEVVLLICTSLITLTYTKTAMICVYFVLIALCITTNMIARFDTTVNVAVLAGMVFATVVYIINITYIIDIFPTTHRGTIVGFAFSFIGIMSIVTEMYQEELTIDNNPMDYISAFYCGLCMICALIAITLPESNAEIPDKDYDLNQRLSSLDDTNRSTTPS